MKLSAIIYAYRLEHDLSQREFARQCGLSNSYISFIEKEINPKTGRPMVPTLEQYKKIADGMGTTVHSLFEKLDADSPVHLETNSALGKEESRLLVAYRDATDSAREIALETLENHPRKKVDTGSSVG